MNLTEVMVSAVVFCSSSAAALAVWSGSAEAVQATRRLEDRADQLEAVLLGTDRWLAAEAASLQAALLTGEGCRFDPQSLARESDSALLLPNQLQRQWQQNEEGAGVWLQLEASDAEGRAAGLQRRQLFTAAAYGLCQP